MDIYILASFLIGLCLGILITFFINKINTESRQANSLNKNHEINKTTPIDIKTIYSKMQKSYIEIKQLEKVINEEAAKQLSQNEMNILLQAKENKEQPKDYAQKSSGLFKK